LLQENFHLGAQSPAPVAVGRELSLIQSKWAACVIKVKSVRGSRNLYGICEPHIPFEPRVCPGYFRGLPGG
jgi:hypothetical protein